MTISRKLAILVLGILCWCPAIPALAWSLEPQPLTIEELLDRASQKLDMGDDFKLALPELRLLVEHPDFDTLAPSDRLSTLMALGGAVAEDPSEHYGVAYFEAAMQLGAKDFDPVYWQLTAMSAAHAGHEATAVAALTAMASTYPDDLLGWPDDLVRYILQGLDDLDQPVARIAVLDGLWRMGYTLADPFENLEAHWLKLAGLYADIGDMARAGTIVASLTEPEVLFSVYLDSRFAAFRPADPAAAMQAARERKLREALGLVAANPGQLRAVTELARRFGSLGRHDEALAAIDVAVQAIYGAAPRRSSFVDAAVELPSLLSEKGARLWDLGRFEEAVAAQRQAAELAAVGGSDWLNQQLGLAKLLVSFGQPAEALSILDGLSIVDPPTAYVTTAGWLRTCALAGLGRDGEAMAEFAAMKTADPLAYDVLRAAATCLDDPAALKELVIRALQRPETRLPALASLQHVDRPPGTAVSQQYWSRFDAVAESPEIVVAAAKYGWRGDWSLSR